MQKQLINTNFQKFKNHVCIFIISTTREADNRLKVISIEYSFCLITQTIVIKL